MPRPTLPLDLRVVGWLNVAVGLAAVVHMVMALVNGRSLLNAAAVFLLVGWGILGLRPGWRRRAIILTVAFPLIGVAGAVLALVLTGTSPFRFLGFAGGVGPGIVVTAVLVAVVIWELRVLTSARTKTLFGEAATP